MPWVACSWNRVDAHPRSEGSLACHSPVAVLLPFIPYRLNTYLNSSSAADQRFPNAQPSKGQKLLESGASTADATPAPEATTEPTNEPTDTFAGTAKPATTGQQQPVGNDQGGEDRSSGSGQPALPVAGSARQGIDAGTEVKPATDTHTVCEQRGDTPDVVPQSTFCALDLSRNNSSNFVFGVMR